MLRTDPAARVAAHHRGGTGLVKVGYPIGVRAVTVAARERLTPRMVRLTLHGPGLDGFHTYQADDHVRLVFPDPDGSFRPPVPAGLELDWPHPMPPTRKYTIRRYDRAARELDLDFVLHGGGLAATWAASVPIGAAATVAGPAGAKAFPHTYDHYVLVADATGLPAVARWLAESPPGVSATVLVETEDAGEHGYPLAERPGVQVSRLVRPRAGSLLAAAVARLAVPDRTFLFGAGEAGDLKPLRAWARDRGCDALVTGYWKRGVAGFDA